MQLGEFDIRESSKIMNGAYKFRKNFDFEKRSSRQREKLREDL